MNELLIYKCDICGYVLEVTNLGKRTLVESGSGFTRTMTVADAVLVCCGKPMTLLTPNGGDASSEKHMPVITFNGDMVNVNVGSKAHPMSEEHSIKWIAILAGGRVQRIDLEPDDKPEADFYIGNAPTVKAYAYCDKHDLWMTTATR